MVGMKAYEAEGILSREMEWRKWCGSIPFIPLEKLSKYIVRAVPPFGCAVIRYVFKNPENDKYCSIYLDCYDSLGIVGEPYWEIYPYDDDVRRILMNEIDELVESIIYVLG